MDDQVNDGHGPTDAELLTMAAAWIRRATKDMPQQPKFAEAGGRLCVGIARRLIDLGHGKLGMDVNGVIDAAYEDLFPAAKAEPPPRIILPGQKQ